MIDDINTKLLFILRNKVADFTIYESYSNGTFTEMILNGSIVIKTLLIVIKIIL